MLRLAIAPATLSIIVMLCCLTIRDAIMLTRKEESSKFHWVSIPTSQAPNYFSVYDLEAMSFNQSLRYCDRKYLGMEPNDYGECCLGSISTGHMVTYSDDFCGDLKPKDYFRRYVPKSSADQPLHKHHNRTLRNMADVIRLMRTNKLVMAGDSIASQVISAAICDWKRHSIDPLVTNYSSFLTQEVNSNHNTPRIKNFIHEEDHIVSHGFWLYDVALLNRTFEFTSSVSKSRSFNSSIVNMKTYRPDLNFTIIQQFSQASDVLLLNYGIHYTNFTEYSTDMVYLLTGLRKFATEKVLIWRETLPQHFDSLGGEFDDRMEQIWDMSTCKTVNFTAFPSLYNMRNKIVVEVADSLGYHIHYVNYHQDISALTRDSENTNVPVLFVIPVYDMFLELSYMHHGHDCSHYCYSPYIWEHIFDRLYKAISIAKKFYKRLL